MAGQAAVATQRDEVARPVRVCLGVEPLRGQDVLDIIAFLAAELAPPAVSIEDDLSLGAEGLGRLRTVVRDVVAVAPHRHRLEVAEPAGDRLAGGGSLTLERAGFVVGTGHLDSAVRTLAHSIGGTPPRIIRCRVQIHG